jgi:hypothetical protein
VSTEVGCDVTTGLAPVHVCSQHGSSSSAGKSYTVRNFTVCVRQPMRTVTWQLMQHNALLCDLNTVSVSPRLQRPHRQCPLSGHTHTHRPTATLSVAFKLRARLWHVTRLQGSNENEFLQHRFENTKGHFATISVNGRIILR